MIVEKKITIAREEIENLLIEKYGLSGEIKFNISARQKRGGSTDGVQNYYEVHELDNVTSIEIIDDTNVKKESIGVNDQNNQRPSIEILKEIIIGELGYHQSNTSMITTGYNSNKRYHPGHPYIVCAIRLLQKCNDHTFEKTMELANYISESWTDIELNDSQIDSILIKVAKILSGRTD